MRRRYRLSVGARNVAIINASKKKLQKNNTSTQFFSLSRETTILPLYIRWHYRSYNVVVEATVESECTQVSIKEKNTGHICHQQVEVGLFFSSITYLMLRICFII